MKQNLLKIIIDRPVEKVFVYTTNPKNTHLWIPSISEEVADEYPPKIGTQYKNRGTDWDYYRVLEFVTNKIFVLTDLESDYLVRYTYKKLSDNQTEMTYFEEMKTGELANPFKEEFLMKLKTIMEKDN